MAKQQQINLQVLLLMTGVLFTALSAAKACFIPYLSIYLRQLGLSANQVGLILGWKSILVAFSASCVGRRMMAFKSARIFLLLTTLLYLAGVLSLSVIPPSNGGKFKDYCVGYKQDSNTSFSSQSRFGASNSTLEIQPTTVTTVKSTVKFASSTTTQTQVQTTSQNQDTTPTLPAPVAAAESHFGLVSTMAATTSSKSTPGLDTGVQSNPKIMTTPRRKQTHPVSMFGGRPKSGTFFDPGRKMTEGLGNTPPVEKLYPTEASPVRSHYHPNNVRPYSSQNSGAFVSNKRYRGKQEHGEQAQESYQDSRQTQPDWKWDGPSERDYGRYRPWNEKQDEDDVDVDPREDARGNGYSQDVLDWLFGRNGKQSALMGYDYGNHRVRRNAVLENQPAANKTRTEDSLVTVLPLESTEDISPKVKTSRSVFTTTFWIALFLVGATEAFAGPIEHMCDTALYHQLDSVDELDKYKRPTILTTPTFAIVGLISAAIVDSTSCFLSNKASHIVIHFYMSSACIAVVFLAGLTVSLGVKVKSPQESKLVKSVKLLYNDSHTAVMSITLVVTAFLSSSGDIFLFWVMQDMQSLETTMGVTLAVAYFTELPMSMVFTPLLVQKLGNVWLLALGTACLGVQNLYYSVLWAPWAAVPIQFLHSLSRAAIRGCVLAYLNEASPPGMGKIVQGSLLALEQGVGVAVGSVLWGFLYGALDSKILFIIVAVGAMAWTVVLIICACRLPVKKRFMYSKLLQSDMEMEMKGGVFGSDSEDNEEQAWLRDAVQDEEEE